MEEEGCFSTTHDWPIEKLDFVSILLHIYIMQYNMSRKISSSSVLSFNFNVSLLSLLVGSTLNQSLSQPINQSLSQSLTQFISTTTYFLQSHASTMTP